MAEKYKYTNAFDNGSSFEYSISPDKAAFEVDAIALHDEWANVLTISREREFDVRLAVNITLLGQLQEQGMLQINLINLTERNSIKDITKVTNDCISQMNKWGYSYYKILNPKTNRYNWIWDLQRQQNK